MLYDHEVRRLNWHPLRDVQRGGRPENYAISVWRTAPLTYLMACGHRSLPRMTICERGCVTAPAWEQPLLRNRTLEALDAFSRRHDPEALPRSRRRALVSMARRFGAQNGYRFVPRVVA